MKKLGYLLITVGFLGGSYSSVYNPETVKWNYFIIAITIGIIGIALVRSHHKQQSRSEGKLADDLKTLTDSLNKIVYNVEQLNNKKNLINTYDMRHRIDELLAEDMINFVQARESIAGKYGLQAYADLMGYFASGERYINRVWSASADGYIDEVNTYLDKAQEQFAGALEKLNRLIIMQE